ncbi:MAG: hypothetical protein WBR17_14395, partial [Paraburkholderia sp.]
ANRPIRMQGKANAVGAQRESAAQTDQGKANAVGAQRESAAQTDQGKANTAGKQTNQRRAGNNLSFAPANLTNSHLLLAIL